MLTLQVIDELLRLQELQGAWSTLVNEADNTTPFHLPAWQLTWWKHFGSGQLETPALFDGNTLVGLVPCFRHEWEGAKQLTLIGSGITDYLEPPIRSGYERCLMKHLENHLVSQNGWDVCNWQDLSSGTPMRYLAASRAMQVRLVEDTSCSAIPLNGNFTDYWQARSNELRRNVRRYTQKAEAEAVIHFAVSETPHAELMDALVALHSARWEKRGESGMIAANQSANFLRDVAAQFAQAGMLRLLTLRWKDRIVAIIFAISWKKTMYGYLSAFDPQFEKLGFGRILLFNSIRYASETGHTSWNFLRGDELYKTWWGAQPIAKSRLIIKRILT
jgi:CelD/BcsL family acetyltransferase involved in cellulose biosynthesis